MRSSTRFYPSTKLLRPGKLLRRSSLTLVVAGLTVANACSPQSSFSPILNQGLVPVSEDNPYMGANLFLAKEMEQSLYLYNFMKEKGAPQAIELKGHSADDLETHLFYASSKEQYVAKPAPTSGKSVPSHEWIIIGPFSVDRNQYRDLQQLEGVSGGAFEIFGRREFLGKGGSPRGEHVQLRPVFIPTPIPRPVAPKRRASKPDVDTSSETIGGKGPLNYDQLALQEAKDMAERNSNGDVVHTVRSKTETIDSITRWYSASSTKTGDVAKKNSLPLDAQLNPGAKIIIPKELVVNSKRMK